MEQMLNKQFVRWVKGQDKHCGFRVKTEMTVFNWKSHFPMCDYHPQTEDEWAALSPSPQRYRPCVLIPAL